MYEHTVALGPNPRDVCTAPGNTTYPGLQPRDPKFHITDDHNVHSQQILGFIQRSCTTCVKR